MLCANGRQNRLSVGKIVISATVALGGNPAQNTAAAAMSSACSMSNRSSGGGGTGRRSRISVATSPGLMQIERMPCRPSSALMWALIMFTPALVAP